MEYTYHPMRIDDYGEVFSLWKSLSGIGLSGADERNDIERYLSHNPDQSFVCRSNGQIVGTILCGNDGRRAYIHHTAVAPKFRRRGIATELVRMAMDEQKKRGIQKCHLFIFNENESGKEFWQESGFSIRNDIGIMSKSL